MQVMLHILVIKNMILAILLRPYGFLAPKDF